MRRHELTFALAACLTALACGAPSASYEASGDGPLAPYGAALSACVASCVTIRGGEGCRGDPFLMFGDPCASPCADEVVAELDVGCMPQKIAQWQCEGAQTWVCESKDAAPVPKDPQVCAPAATAYNDCSTGGWQSLTGLPKAVGACKSACRAIAKKPGCESFGTDTCKQDCEALATTLPEPCVEASVAQSACWTGVAWACGGTLGKTLDRATPAATLANCVKTGGKICTPKETTCDGDKVVACSADGLTKATAEDCEATGGICKKGACFIPECVWAQVSCKGDTVVTCGDGVYELTKDCAKQGLICKDGTCIEKPCDSGAFWCKSSVLWACGNDGKWALVEDCAKPDPCRAWSCSETKGVCESLAKPVGTPCTVDDVCLTGATCDAAQACSGAKPNDCNDGAACTEDSCQAGVGCVNAPKHETCDDGQICTLDVCDGAAGCIHATDPCPGGKALGSSCYKVGDGEAYTWNEAEAYCQNLKGHLVEIETMEENAFVLNVGLDAPGKPTTFWIGLHRNALGAFVWPSETPAGFVNFGSGQPNANGKGVTMTKSGQWSAYPDGTAWNGQVCELPLLLGCDDGDPCTIGDACDKGVCLPGTVTDCTDGNPCTADACAKATGCAHVIVTGPCDDGDGCTIEEACEAGVCLGKPVNCSDGITCTTDTCASVKGQAACVHSPNNGSCADGNVCTSDVCDPEAGCQASPVADDAPCDDGSSCTKSDTCKGGKCVSGAALCEDDNPCTVDLCDEATQSQCSHNPVAAGVSCSLGLACSAYDVCDGKGVCVSAAANECDDKNPCTVDSCKEPAGCGHVAQPLPVTCGPGLVCVGVKCAPAGTCGNGKVDSLGEQCDDGNGAANDGCAPDCTLEPALSCAALLSAFPYLPSGVYTIDPDGAAPVKAISLHCDMSGTGWTLVGNYYDSPGNDFPDLPGDVTVGWAQAPGGGWQLPQAVTPDASGSGSGAVGMAFVAAMAQWGSSSLRMCFVAKDGHETECRQSPDGLGLAAEPGGNLQLAAYAYSKLVWTFGRLAGLAASHDGYDDTGGSAASCVPKTAGATYLFGGACPAGAASGLCEGDGANGWHGVWCALCDGQCYRPDAKDDDELGAGAVAGSPASKNPSESGWGFRLYVGK